MVNVLGWQIFAALIAVVTIACGAIAFPFNSPESVLEFIGLFSKTGFALSVLIIWIGQSSAFPWLCKQWPLKLIVPDIDGAWKGEISSNWPLIAAAHDIKDQDGNDFKDRATPITADICVKLLSISIELKSVSGYQNSKTLNCTLKRNSHRGFELSYVYRSSVPDPKQSDEQTFLGAGLIDFTSRSPSGIDGVYWTNRNWQKGQNPAGTIKLKRK